jgi:CRISPR-associated endonuclease Csn1
LPKALPSVEARVIFETLNQLRFGEGLTLNGKLSAEHRDLYAATLMSGKNVTFKQMRKTLKLGEGVRFSLEDAGKMELKDYRAKSGMLGSPDCFGSRWLDLPLQERDEIVMQLVEADQEQDVVSWLQSTYQLAEDAARNVAAWSPPEGYARLGRTANDKVLAELKATDLPTYAEAVKRAGWHHSDERDGIIELPLPYYGKVLERHVLFGSGNADHAAERRYGRFPNPTVHVALNQLRHVVNQLVQAYGEPSQIVIELARDLKQTREQKEEDQKRNRSNRTVKDRHRVILAEQRQIEAGDNFLRLRLFEEQERAGGGLALCPFSLKPITIARLFSSDVEIEHLLPYSKTFDDSAANKVVCLRSTNRFKRAKTPYEACSAPAPEAAKVFAPWESIVAAAQGLPSNKRWRFGPEAMERFENKERDFLTRQLNETRHLSRLARIYLSKACDPDQVYVTTGQLTAMLRSRWGLNSIWRDHNRSADDDNSQATQMRTKGRDDHRHHAVDACTIGAIDRSLLQEMSKRAGQAEIEGMERITSDVPEPFAGFRDAVRSAVEKVVVSMKPEHGMGGALHEDTAYGLVTNSGEAAVIGNLVYRKPLTDLKPGEIDSVRDAHLRKQLQDLVAPLRDARGKVTKENEKDFEAALTKFSSEEAPGRAQGVRRVRIGKAKTGELHVKNRQTGAIYKALLPGENHHIDIVQMRDGSWQGFAATVFDVNQKEWRPEWEVKKLGGKLVMRVHKGDAVQVDDPDGVRRIKTVHRLSPSNSVLYLAPHNEGGALGKRHDDKEDPFRWDFANIGGLKARNAEKVKIDAVGRTTAVRSNA